VSFHHRSYWILALEIAIGSLWALVGARAMQSQVKASQAIETQTTVAQRELALPARFPTNKLDPKVAMSVDLAYTSAESSIAHLNQVRTEVSPKVLMAAREAGTVFSELAGRARAGETLNEQDANRMTAAAADMAVLVDWSKIRGNADPMVSVTVNTRDKNGNPVPNCQVWYELAFYVGDRSEEFPFDRFSTPTTQVLRVGDYVMWAAKDGGIGTRKPVLVGADGATAKTVDLLAPQQP
jgi:hypothetical protein